MVPPAKVCATFSALPEADQQKRLDCQQQVTAVSPLRAGLQEAPRPAWELKLNQGCVSLTQYACKAYASRPQV